MLKRLIQLLDATRVLDFLAPLGFRVYLAPIFIVFGFNKISNIDSIIQWFDHGLQLPMPTLMAYLAAYTELFGGVALLLGFATRLVSVPLMITMIVAAMTAHWSNGWFAITPTNPNTNIASLIAPLGVEAAEESLQNSVEAGKRLRQAKVILKEHGHYEWLTEKGGFAILNNGIEFATTYFLMLLSLFFTGGGRWISIDDWILRRHHADRKTFFR